MPTSSIVLHLRSLLLRTDPIALPVSVDVKLLFMHNIKFSVVRPSVNENLLTLVSNDGFYVILCELFSSV